ncbi:MAG: DMT family transporter [Reyranella sp.]|uniref:DMT family transporter n=1 Tax=Reyranella sp. TaxID=1929291 RepID=UPI001AD4DADC|nr:DMT family transporter [Reyranella sp.]MBN9086145.1 DMT family transporter [Reyranella sp.]
MSAAALALAAAACFAWGQVLIQFGLRTVPSWRSPIYSIGGSAVLAWIFAVIFVDFRQLNLEAALIFAGVGLIFPVAVSMLSVRSNEALGPAVASAVGNVAPAFAVLGAILFLGERPGAGQLAGLALVVMGVALLALRGGTGGRQWPMWVLALPLSAALIRGAIQPAIKTALALWHEPMAAAAIGYTTSTFMILVIAGRRAWRVGPADRRGVMWFTLVGVFNGAATFLLYAALGLGSIALVAPLVALFPLIAVVLSLLILRERLPLMGLLGIAVSVAGVIVLLLPL